MDGTVACTTGRASAIAAIRAEHHALADVVELLRHLLKDIALGHAEPDFHLLAKLVHYIDDFSCRCHHPREELYLFAKIRRYVPEAGDALTGLGAEHQRDYALVKDLHYRLVRYQAGAPGALGHFMDCVDVYAAMLREHMRREEALMEACADAVPEAEWTQIATDFEREDDPLFAPAPRREFEKLRAGIINLLPTKLRRHAHELHADEVC